MNGGRETRAGRGAAMVLVGVLTLVLGSAPPAVGASPTAASSSSCGGTVVRSDHRLPAWTRSARPPAGVPYAVSSDGNVVAVLFGNPLRHGRPTGHANKILWIVREARGGRALQLTAHPRRSTSPSVRVTVAADAAPGEIYPSVLDVPSSGCWQVLLAWNGRRSTVALRYR